jgi:deoxyribose-phosphate aldolase
VSSPDIAVLANSMDQTLLSPTATLADAAAWMESSRDAGFATLCVSPFLVPLAGQRLAGTTTRVCSVAGFPLGYSLTETKAEEAVHLVSLGCSEVDMVVNIGALLAGEDEMVRDDIAAVVDAVATAGAGSALVKVILETGYLEEADVVRGSRLAVEAGAAFVKTSTGFGPRGASVRDVELMRQAVGPDIGVKAAGGIRDLDAALAMLEAGADRLGTSAGLEILAQAAARGL